jgi:hypothetical protein
VEGKKLLLVTFGSVHRSAVSRRSTTPSCRALPVDLGHQDSTGIKPNWDKAQTQLVLDLLYTVQPPPSRHLRPAKPPERREGGAGI